MISNVSPFPDDLVLCTALRCKLWLLRVGKPSAFVGPLVSSATLTAFANNNNTPFSIPFYLPRTVSTLFLYFVDFEKSCTVCDQFVVAEANCEAFKHES